MVVRLKLKKGVKMQTNFDDYPDFQQKARGLQDYEKHCRIVKIVMNHWPNELQNTL